MQQRRLRDGRSLALTPSAASRRKRKLRAVFVALIVALVGIAVLRA